MFQHGASLVIINTELLDPIRIHINVPFSQDYTGMESSTSGYICIRTPLIFLKTGSIRHRHCARPPPALSWPPAFRWPLPAFRQPHLGPILPHGGLPSIHQVKSSQVINPLWKGLNGVEGTPALSTVISSLSAPCVQIQAAGLKATHNRWPQVSTAS